MIARFFVCSLALSSVACSKEDQKNLIDKVVDAAADAPAPIVPKNLDLAKAAFVTAKAKHPPTEADCAPLKSFEADFADSKDPDAIKTTHDIDAFCGIDVSLTGAVATLKADNTKLTDATAKKDKTTMQMYAATVKDNCSSIHDQLDALAAKHLDGDPKVTALKADIDPICSPPAKKK